MNSMVANLFVSMDVIAIKSAVNSIHRLTNGQLFKGIDIFLASTCNHGHYFLYVVNLAKSDTKLMD